MPAAVGSLARAVSAADHRFPPIGSYGFLSDCHTSALVSYDGAVEWLCLPRFDSPSAFARPARPRRRPLQAGAARRRRPDQPPLRAGHAGDRDDLGDRHRLGRRPRRADDRRVGDRRTARRGRPRPSTSPTTRCCGTMTCIDGEVEMEMECLPRFGYGAEAAELERRRAGRSGRPRRRRDRAAPDQRHGAVARRTAPPAARCSLREDETGFCAVTWGDGDLGGPRSAPEALERLDSTEEFWRELAARRQLPRPPLAHPPAALGAGPQGPHLHADRRDRRRPDHLAARDPGRRTQLGLPLQLDPRLDLQPLGAAHARLRPGGARLHALRRSTSAARTRTCRSCTGSAARRS